MKNLTCGLLLALGTAHIGCAAATRTGDPDGVIGARAGVAGFDTRDYPGTDVMQAWFEESPYRWTGYYLPAPCYTGTTWQGARAPLRAIGYGFAVLFVGEQDWSAMSAIRDTTAPVDNPRCASANLSADRGTADAAAAAAAAAAEGFPQNTIVFLDVERVERVSPALAAYVRAWTAALLAGGRYEPGLYAHDSNTPALYAIAAAEFERVGRTSMPRLWVARQTGFSLDRSPAESGYPVASIWQGMFNTRETWGGTSLNIDVNTASSSDPSRGR